MDNVICHIAIVGCGLGGLAAAIALKRQGHDVMILEQAAHLNEAGAGIQIPPNSARILDSWGLLEPIRAHSTEPEALILRDYRDGTVLFETRIVPGMQDAYGSPWLLIHRADYFKVLLREAERLGVKIRVGCAVTHIACSSVPISISNSAGADIHADIVLGADGLRSKCRKLIQNSSEQQLTTKGFVHRITVADDAISAHIELVKLLGTSVTNTWMGPGAHVVTYPLKSSNAYNFVFLCDNLLDNLSDMRSYFQNWDHRLTLVLEIARDLKQWPLDASVGNERWIHPVGSFMLLGDACHAMLPYLAQGAAQAVEDGAVLGALFGNLRNKEDIRNRLLMYEQLRKPRATRVRDLSVENDKIFHMLDCAERKKKAGQGERAKTFGSSQDKMADAGLLDWLFGHDVIKEAEDMKEGKKN